MNKSKIQSKPNNIINSDSEIVKVKKGALKINDQGILAMKQILKNTAEHAGELEEEVDADKKIINMLEKVIRDQENKLKIYENSTIDNIYSQNNNECNFFDKDDVKKIMLDARIRAKKEQQKRVELIAEQYKKSLI